VGCEITIALRQLDCPGHCGDRRDDEKDQISTAGNKSGFHARNVAVRVLMRHNFKAWIRNEKSQFVT
jgi:hypothetical protein